MNKLAVFFLMGLSSMTAAQISHTPGTDVLRSIEEREKKRESSIFKNYPVRNVGPVVQGGRVSDIAVNPLNPKKYYVAFASGGVFKTENNGISFTPVFDNQGNLTIGDIAVAPSDPDRLWVGTGENNSSRSSYAGSGVYQSIDDGKTWTFAGLESIQHTGRIIVHPEDPETVWVAALGNLYSFNPERGVYKTTNGGRTWEKTLFVNDSTGAIDLVIHPLNPDILWAAMWERTRKAWNFTGHGPGSGIYKSEDGGITWRKVMKGINNPDMAGRIGIDVSQSDPGILYAIVDNQLETKEEKKREAEELIAADFIGMEIDDFLALEDKKLDDFLDRNDFPDKYNAEVVKREVKEGKYKPGALAEYLGDANTSLFETEIAGAEIYKSSDAGETWEKTHEFVLDGVYYTYGYYFGEIRVSPRDPEKIFVFGVPLLKSDDGGKNFSRIDTAGDVHADQQAMWIDPQDPAHILLGNDGGLYVTYDEGAAWDHINNIPAGQFYTVSVDRKEPYNIYGGLQDNGILFGSSESVPNETEPWEYLFGGDGMFVIPDPDDPGQVYLGYQFGNYYRLNTETGKREFIAPRHDIGEIPLRYNWRAPLIMSEHNPDILYIGAQRIYRSMDGGKQWKCLSRDLTKDLENGNVPFSTITCIEESPVSFGLLYVGTDDGNVQVSRNGGFEWEQIGEGLPENKWVTCLFASPHRESKVYLAMTGYREDDFSTYVYRSSDYGNTWKSINGAIMHEGVNVIVEDPEAEGLLYLGTDHGTYLSFNEGEEWHLMAPIPNVAAYDMTVHTDAHDLVVATHGRSIYVLPLEPIRSLHQEPGFRVFKPDAIRHSNNWGEKKYPFSKVNQPACRILYFAPEPGMDITFEVRQEGKLVRQITFSPSDAGFNYFTWDLRINQPDGKKIRKTEKTHYAGKGKYDARFIWEERVETVKISIE